MCVYIYGNDDTKNVDFFLAWDSGKHSLLPVRGRTQVTVPAKNFSEALKEATCLKMDVEGAEYDLIKSVEDWSNIRIAIIEYHIIEIYIVVMIKFFVVLIVEMIF